MSSKISLFNKTVFKTDIKRNWWTAVLLTLALFLGTTLPLYHQITYFQTHSLTRDVEYIQDRVTNTFQDFGMVSYVFGIAAAVFVSAILFSYLTKSASVSCVHGLPVTRKQLYFTHLFSGALLLICPVLVNGVFWTRAISYGLDFVEILKVLFVYILYAMLCFMLTTLLGVVMGNTASQVIFSGCIALLPLLLAAFVEIVSQGNLYGYYSQGKIFELLTHFVYLPPAKLVTVSCLIYVISTIVLCVAGYVFYRARHLENHGEVIAFDNLKGLFKTVFAVCCGILGYFYALSMWHISNVLIMLPFAFVGLAIAHMLAIKSLSLKGIVPSLISTIAVIFVIFGICEFDLTGFEKRVPDIDDIEYACFTNNYVETNYWTDGERYEYTDVYYPHFTDEDEIQMFIDFHKFKVDNRNVDSGRTITFMYKLKNGREMYRQYSFVSDEQMLQYIKPIYETQTYKMYEYPYFDTTEKSLKYVVVGRSSLYDGKRFTADSDQAKMLIEAMKLDMQNRTYEQSQQRQRHGSLLDVRIVYARPVKYEGTNLKVSNWKSLTNVEETYIVTIYDTNTLDVLEKMGVLEAKRNKCLEDTRSVSLYAYLQSQPNPEDEIAYELLSSKYVTETVDYDVMYKESEFTAVFEDASEIEQIYDFIMQNMGLVTDETTSNVRLEFRFNYLGGSEQVYDYAQVTVPFESVPQFIKEKLITSK